MWGTVLFALVSATILVLAWLKRWRWGLDPTVRTSHLRKFDKYSKWHFILPLVHVMVGYLIFQASSVGAFLTTLLFWIGVEVIQFYPRGGYDGTSIRPGSRTTGHFDPLDLVLDFFGVSVGIILAHFVRGLF